MFLSPTSEDEVISIVKTCKQKTSTDSNDLSMSVIKTSYSTHYIANDSNI